MSQPNYHQFLYKPNAEVSWYTEDSIFYRAHKVLAYLLCVHKMAITILFHHQFWYVAQLLRLQLYANFKTMRFYTIPTLQKFDIIYCAQNSLFSIPHSLPILMLTQLARLQQHTNNTILFDSYVKAIQYDTLIRKLC